MNMTAKQIADALVGEYADFLPVARPDYWHDNHGDIEVRGVRVSLYTGNVGRLVIRLSSIDINYGPDPSNGDPRHGRVGAEDVLGPGGIRPAATLRIDAPLDQVARRVLKFAAEHAGTYEEMRAYAQSLWDASRREDEAAEAIAQICGDECPRIPRMIGGARVFYARINGRDIRIEQTNDRAKIATPLTVEQLAAVLEILKEKTA